jgi:hypothetical protein
LLLAAVAEADTSMILLIMMDAVVVVLVDI